MGTEEEMRLIDLAEDLHMALEILKSDAQQLAGGERPDIGVVELEPNWEEQIPRLIHRYEKRIDEIFNSYNDPHGEDELNWIKAHFDATKDFLITH